MANSSASVKYQADFIVLSYFTSLVGCITTLELLQRRTSWKGARNWVLMEAACVAMGGVGIWCMHFIASHALVLGNGSPDEQIVYSDLWTGISFLLPVLVLNIAFHVLALDEHATCCVLVLAGFLTGTAVCGMHYLAEYGIANYNCSYNIPHVVGAAAVAVCASVVALGVFFRLHYTWTDSWWKRILCASGLAIAVSGMHWTAALGTTYEHTSSEVKVKVNSRSRLRTVIVCTVLAMTSCAATIIITAVTSRRRKLTRRSARDLTLACVYFDEQGHVMADPDGVLPYQKIMTKETEQLRGDDDLNRPSPIYTWLYRASRNWNSIESVIAYLQQSSEDQEKKARFSITSGRRLRLVAGFRRTEDRSTPSAVLFQKSFCLAAHRLATQIQEPMADLGTLYIKPLATGGYHTKVYEGSLEELGDTAEEGRYLFVIRQISKSRSSEFQARGYRFGAIAHLTTSIASNMQVDPEVLAHQLDCMRIAASPDGLPKPGVHVAFLSLRPAIQHAFDVMVLAAKRNQLPMVQVDDQPLTDWQKSLMQQHNDKRVCQVSTALSAMIMPGSEDSFASKFHDALVNQLPELVGDAELVASGRFSAQPVRIPCRASPEHGPTRTCDVFIIRYMSTPRTVPTTENMVYAPLGFFSAQQHVSTAFVDHEFKKELFALFSVQAGAKVETTTQRSTKEEAPGLFMEKRPSLQSLVGCLRNFLARMVQKASVTFGKPNPQSRRDAPRTEDTVSVNEMSQNLDNEKFGAISHVRHAESDESRALFARQRQMDLKALKEDRGSFVPQVLAWFNI